ncbi:MAG TPA: Hsp70 family protein [Pirellulales bacterium]|nr:Hsp70 family protein [Pirellulales bacterium]
MSGDTHNLVGIDLGTTFSVIAHLDAKGKPVTLSNKDGDPLTPSAIYLNGNSAVVGKTAREAAPVDAGRVALCVKRDMGGARYAHAVDGRTFRPETLSAIILRKLKQDAERHIGPISRAVITVPAFFNETRRKATEDAGRIAGLEVIDVLNEPTAAALSYAMAGQSSGASPLDLPGGRLTALVYDLGGGTFDVTVVRMAAQHFETLATDGAVQLGGRDWDEKIVHHVATLFRRRFGLDPLSDEKRRAALTALAERSKVLLSDLPEVPVEFFHREYSLNLTLTRPQFEEMTRELLAQTQIVTELVVAQAKLTWPDIDRVLLVGGSTRMPMIKEMLRKATGKEPDDSLDADQVVARGAAIHAGIVEAKGKPGRLEIDDDVRERLENVEVLNVNAYSLGIEATKQGQQINAFLIPKNTPLPFAASRMFRLTKAGATHVVVKVLEGESESPADNIPIGECIVTGLPPDLPLRSPVQVRLSYGANGRISVMALDMAGGRFAEAEIKREYGLTEDDIRRETEFVRNLTIR